jgi:predicted alpha/beta-fold hydrolase
MIIYKLLKKPFFGHFMVKWRNPLTEDEKRNWKEISVSSKSGATISGLYAITENPKATIVLGHPMGKEAKGYFLKHGYTDLLISNGYNVIIFDINGFGESTMGNFSFYEDIVSISKKAKELFPNLQIGYHGISLGGQYASISFADNAHCYDFAIIESAPTTLDEFWIHFPFAYNALKLFNVFMPKYKTKINMVERIKEAKKLKSILFIYSDTDTWATTSMGKRFHENCAVMSELWTVPVAKHAMIVKSEYSEQYKQKIVAYFDHLVAK